MTYHRITDTERAALARVPVAELLAIAAPDRRTTHAIVACPGLMAITLQRLALCRLKAGELCLIPRTTP